MSDQLSHPTPTAIQPIAMRLRNAAKVTGLSERTIWGHTAPRGSLPCVRVGSAVLYRVDDLHRWLAERAAESVRSADGEGVSQ